MLVAGHDLAPEPVFLHRLRAERVLPLEASMMVERIEENDVVYVRGDELHRDGLRKRRILKDMLVPIISEVALQHKILGTNLY